MAARGLWIEMIALMHEATPYGHLLVSGLSPTDAQLAVLAGAPSDQITDLIGELETAGVFSRTSARVIYSRKMTRMAKQAALARKNGKSGGNPSLCIERENPPPDNPPDNLRDKPQKPEARSQNMSEGKPSLAPSPALTSRFAEFWEAYPHRDGVKRARSKVEVKYRAAVKGGISEQSLIDAAVRFRSDKRVRDGFACDPLTWFSRRGWEDEPAAPLPLGRPLPNFEQALDNLERGIRAGRWPRADLLTAEHVEGLIRRKALTREEAAKRNYPLAADPIRRLA